MPRTRRGSNPNNLDGMQQMKHVAEFDKQRDLDKLRVAIQEHIPDNMRARHRAPERLATAHRNVLALRLWLKRREVTTGML